MDFVIVGAGGHGKVVLDIFRAAASAKLRPVGFLDANPSLTGTLVGGLPVLGNIHHIAKLKQQKVRAAVVAIGDNRARFGCTSYLLGEGIELLRAMHPRACVSPSATIGSNVVICAGAIVCAEARVADSAILNTASVVEHECEIGEAAHVCPAATLAGRVRVGAGAFVGTGAKVIPCITIGEHSTVGAGAVVVRDVPPGARVMGVPARVTSHPCSMPQAA